MTANARKQADELRAKRAQVWEPPIPTQPKRKQLLMTSFTATHPRQGPQPDNPLAKHSGARGPTHPACESLQQRMGRLKKVAIMNQEKIRKSELDDKRELAIELRRLALLKHIDPRGITARVNTFSLRMAAG